MAALTPWSAALWALLPPLLAAVGATLHGPVTQRLLAGQLAAAIGACLLMLMSFVFDQSSYIDLALTLVVLNVTAALVMAVALERWL